MSNEARAQQIILDSLLKAGDEMVTEGVVYPSATALMTEVSRRAARALAEEGLV